MCASCFFYLLSEKFIFISLASLPSLREVNPFDRAYPFKIFFQLTFCLWAKISQHSYPPFNPLKMGGENHVYEDMLFNISLIHNIT